MKIQLIRPPFDSWCNNKGQMTELEAPPIGLAIIAKCVRDADVEIIDGLNLPLDEIVKQINGNIIGVSDIYSNHLNSLKILRINSLTFLVSFFLNFLNIKFSILFHPKFCFS